jgi:hypothetical protein
MAIRRSALGRLRSYAACADSWAPPAPLVGYRLAGTTHLDRSDSGIIPVIAGSATVRFASALLVAVTIAAALADSAQAELFFLFRPTAAHPGEQVTIRAAGTPLNFSSGQRSTPLLPPIRLYLVRNAVAAAIKSPRDRRLHHLGPIVLDRNARGLKTFTVPRLPPASYAVAYVCPSCARYSFGRTFFVARVDADVLPRFRPLMLLRIQTS